MMEAEVHKSGAIKAPGIGCYVLTDSEAEAKPVVVVLGVSSVGAFKLRTLRARFPVGVGAVLNFSPVDIRSRRLA